MAEDSGEWDSHKMLDVYIHDYLVRNKLHASAESFKTESNLPDHTPATEDAPQGLLYEAWFVYWDICLAMRHDKRCSNSASAYIETQKTKAREHKLQMQQLLVMQQDSEQLPQRDSNHSVLAGSLNAMNSKGMMKPPAAPPAALVSDKMYEERKKRSNSMGSGTSLTSMDAYMMALLKSATSHHGHLVRDHSENVYPALTQFQTKPLWTTDNEREVNLGANPMGLPMDPYLFEQTMLQSDYGLSDAGLYQGNTILPVKGWPNLPNQNQLLDSQWQRASAQAQVLMNRSSKNVQSARTQVQSGSPQMNMAQARHSLSQLQQNDRINTASRMQHVNNAQKSIMMDGTKGTGGLASSSNFQENMELFEEVATSDDNIEFFQSDNGGVGGNAYGTIKQTLTEQKKETSKSFSLAEFHCIRASNSEISCCDFSSDGKLLASAGHAKKVVLWNMDNLQTESTPEDQNSIISDVRFRPNSSGFATSCIDKCVRLWDAANPRYCVEQYFLHDSTVMSLDFHPKKTDILCVSDSENVIQYWNITKSSSIHSFKGGKAKVRFQPRVGQLLAAAYDKIVSIFDAETSRQICSLQGHPEAVSYICWDANGDTLASLSPNLVKIWSLNSGKCFKEFKSSRKNKFHSCVFHPRNSTMFVIGGNSSLMLWNLAYNIPLSIPAHEDRISALVHSPATEMVASASHDGFVRLWK